MARWISDSPPLTIIPALHIPKQLLEAIRVGGMNGHYCGVWKGPPQTPQVLNRSVS